MTTVRPLARGKPARKSAVTRPAPPKISLVVPLFNEGRSVPELTGELISALVELGRPYEIIYVDDGSLDDTAAVIAGLAAVHPEIRGLNLARNYGQSSAMQAGFDAARGDIVICLDGDLQNDPGDIPRLVRVLEEDGVDLVSGWRRRRQDSAVRVLMSRLANRLISRLTGVRLHDIGCSLKAYRRGVLSRIRLYGEMHRFIPVLLAETGAKISEIEVNHRPRQHGRSKYHLDRTVRVLLDLLLVLFYTRYRQRPMHFFGGAGLAAAAPGGLICLYLLILKLGGASIGDRPLLLLGVMLLITGVTLTGLGLVAELLVRLLHESDNYPQYRLKSRRGIDDT